MIESDMSQALELLQYANRFRNQRFVLVLSPDSEVSNLILDLRLLELAGIQVVVLACESSVLEEAIAQTSQRGSKLKFYNGGNSSTDTLSNQHFNLRERLNELFQFNQNSEVPVLALPFRNSIEDLLEDFEIIEACNINGVKKIFLISEFEGLVIEGKLISHVGLKELFDLSNQTTNKTNINQRLINLVYSSLSKFELEVVLLGDARGNLYEEIFTHRGCGTLISGKYHSEIRPAVLSDTYQIYLLIKPAINDLSVLPMSESEIAASIDSYSVYTVNGEIIAAARLTPYGEYAEVGKFSTMPRFRGQGMAQVLAQNLISKAKNQGFKGVFALSTIPKMWTFFEKLGFIHIDRSELPIEWQNGYDFLRPSKALILRFS